MNNENKQTAMEAADPSPHMVRWHCMNCRRQLGVLAYDQVWGCEAMHIKEKDTVIAVVPGEGGMLRRICPGCGTSQHIMDDSIEDDRLAGAPEPDKL